MRAAILQIDHNIKGQSATELLIKQAHALINFCAFSEVIDEAVFHPQLAQSNHAEQQYQTVDHQHGVVQPVCRTGEKAGQIQTKASTELALVGLEQAHDRRKKCEGDQ